MTKQQHSEFMEIHRRAERGEVSPEDIVELVATVPGFRIWWEWRRRLKARRKVERQRNDQT